MARKVELTQAILDDIIRRVVEVAQPVQIILFGSAAHGEMTSDSDVDLLVVKEAQINRGEHEENIYRNFFGLTIPVDVIVVTTEDIEKYRDKVGTIIRPALREGRTIYDVNSRPDKS